MGAMGRFGIALLFLAAAAAAQDLGAAARLAQEPLDVQRAQRIRLVLSAYTPDRLAALAEFQRLDRDTRRRLLRALRAAVFAERHAALKQRWTIGLLLYARSAGERFRAGHLLTKEPFTEALHPVAMELSKSPHPELRLAAGRLAKLLCVFLGTNAEREALAKRLLQDKHPNVAMLFGLWDAHDFESKAVVDAMAGAIRDVRELEQNVPLCLATWEGSVSRGIRTRLFAEFMVGFLEQPMVGRQSPSGRILRRWWAVHRDEYAFGANPKLRRLLVSWKGVVEQKKWAAIGNGFDARVDRYSEKWINGRPKVSAVVLFRRGQEDLGGGGPNNAEAGEKQTGRSNMVSREVFVVADHAGRLRLRVRLWEARLAK